MSAQQTNPNENRPEVPFNPYAPGYDVNPHPALEKLRAEAPIFYWEQGRCWVLSRYEDGVTVLRDDKRFSPNRDDWEFASVLGADALIPEMEELNKNGLFALNEGGHARVRRLVSPAFTPRATERLRPEIQAITDEVLDTLAAKGRLDMVKEFSERIPARVIGSMLKIPQGHEEQFLEFTNAVAKSVFAGALAPEELAPLRRQIHEGIVLVTETIDDRRRNPLENDILTTLIQTEEQGDKLNKQELLALVSSLIVGGFETTVHLVSFCVYNLLQQPGVLAEVKSKPELIKNLVEEVLRFDYFVKMGAARYAREDVELGGMHIKKGQMLLVLLGSVLRDERAFDKAHVFDLQRNANVSIAFGHGAHFCLGANLARLMVQIAMGSLVRRFPEMRLVKQPSFGPHSLMRKMEELEVDLGSPSA
ncbi:putative cytochrome P450 hydroxylase [Cystobacter fuscus DSM 2262]|uniref:Cytochrome P450 hydroxylase n=1 Tax=Cystobacter fuscus (strain ATCC 25194 / DSM 2262 / NBRC 100088 / M29) TaxID=1242864 RepID=S9NXN9_CYSF2|nr:cytochrome P450 [Cystobacter fuscus]EPX56990.1 putative cytochrome P450 hydroxylase [Cystobacter fuscus DSM 2262]